MIFNLKFEICGKSTKKSKNNIQIKTSVSDTENKI